MSETTKILTKDLEGDALDWLVAKCDGHAVYMRHDFLKARAKYLNHDGKTLPWHLSQQTNDPIVGILETGETEFLPRYSIDWSKAGPIIDRECISVIRADDDFGTDKDGYCNNVRIPVWCADRGQQSTTTSTECQSHDAMFQFYASEVTYGPTPLIAAMRRYVAFKLGPEVDVPTELVSVQTPAKTKGMTP